MTGFIQLICSGTEQMFLNNDATIDFFHIIYRRYSNFFINTIVENNNNFIVINKPSGIPVQSGTRSFKNIIDKELFCCLDL